MIPSSLLREFLGTQNLSSRKISAIEKRLDRVEVKAGILKGSFSDCDSEFVLGDPKLEEAFTVFHDKKYGFIS